MKTSMLRLSCLMLAATLFSGAQASAYTKDELNNAVDILNQQLDKLDRQPTRSCPQDHKPIFASGKSLKVSLYYGYEDYGDTTFDSVHARALAEVLEKTQCTPNLVVCEFKKVQKTKNMTRLKKTIKGREVIISIYSTSVTNNNKTNMDAKQAEQAIQSQAVINQFHTDLSQADIVFYSGHSRLGGGLGFTSQGFIQGLIETITRLPLRPMMKALEVRPSRLKVLGLFSCDSNKYYRVPVEERNPYINLIVSKDDIDSDEGEQQQLGALNSILGEKCDPEVKDALISEVAPSHDVLQYIRRPFK